MLAGLQSFLLMKAEKDFTFFQPASMQSQGKELSRLFPSNN
jgi:hypothetical protein